jgi:hypothetical protein
MFEQEGLFDGPPVSRRDDPPTSKEAERLLNKSGRRVSQKGKLLDRLLAGPATNVELAQLCIKYTGRISDLRADGWDIACVRQTEEGVTVYTLRGKS